MHVRIPAVIMVLLVGRLSLSAYQIDQEQNNRISDVENRLIKLEERIRQERTRSEKQAEKPSIKAEKQDRWDQKIKELEKKNAELEAKLNGISTGVAVGKGTLTVNGILQTTFGMTESAAASAKTSFNLKRARLLFSGTLVPGEIKYFIQTELASNPAILDSKLSFNYLPATELAIGRFVPAFSYYMPCSTAKLDFVNYPVVITEYGMWRQTGVQSTTKFPPLEITAGVFNGYPANNTSDNNDAKDLLFGVNMNAAKGLRVLTYSWLGNSIAGPAAGDVKNRYGGGVLFEKNSTSFKGEYIAGLDRGGTGTEIRSSGFYAQAAYKISQRVEVLARFDNFDGNADVPDDAVTWVTGGLNYYLLGQNAMFYFNYIRKTNELSPDPRDDEFTLQAQIFF